MIEKILEYTDAGAWTLLTFYLLFRFEKVLKQLTQSNKSLHTFLKNGWRR